MSSPRRTAVSYSRFSHFQQSTGDSIARQERAYREFCERHNLTPGKEVFCDRGRSGYHDEHRKNGKLGELLAAAKDGRFDRGTVIVIEAWDRLGRLRPDDQTRLVSDLLKTGVSIGVCGIGKIYSEADLGTPDFMMLAAFILLAHQESKQKAERIASSWAKRRALAKENGTFMRSSLPAWVELGPDGKPREIPERAAILRRIFKLTIEGMGQTRIIKLFTKEKVPPFGERIIKPNRKRSQFAGHWNNTYIGSLLRDRRALGELKAVDGTVLKDYYPKIVDEADFNLAAAGLDSRRRHDKLGRKIGPHESQNVNVFRELLTHARDGEGFVLDARGGKMKPSDVRLINLSAAQGRTDRSYSFPYYLFEEQILKRLKEIDVQAILPKDGHDRSTADTLRAQQAKIREDLAEYRADLRAHGPSKMVLEFVRKLEAEDEEVGNELQDELARIAKPLEKTWREAHTLIDVIREAKDPDAARLKFRPVLRAIVQSAHVLIVKRHAWQLLAVQFNFTGGDVRHYLLTRRAAAIQRPAFAMEPRSFAEAQLPDSVDLRKKKDVDKIMRRLEQMADELQAKSTTERRERLRTAHARKWREMIAAEQAAGKFRRRRGAKKRKAQTGCK